MADNLPSVNDVPISGTTTVKAPDNKLYTVPNANLDKALQAGWTLATSDDLDHEAKVKAKMNEIAGGALGPGVGVGVNYFLNEAAAGVPNTVYHYTDTPEEKEARERLYEQHTGAAWAGGLAGAAGNLLLTHGAGKALGEAAEHVAPKAMEAISEFEKAKPFVSKVLGGAVTGGAYAVPQAVTQSYYGDPESAAESILWGTGVGAGLGAISAAAQKGLGSIGSLDTSKWAADLTDKADQMTTERAGINANKASKLGSDRLANIANVLENDEFLNSPKLSGLSNFERADALSDDAGEKLGQHFDQVDKLLDSNDELHALKPTPTSLSTEFTVKTLNDHPEFGITNVTTPDDVEMIEGVKGPPLFNTELQAMKDVTKTIKAIGAKSADDEMNMSDLQKLGKLIQPKTKFDQTTPNGVRDVYRSAWNFIKEKQMQIADQAYAKADMVGSRADYELQKNRYRVAQELLKYGEKEFTPNNYGMPTSSLFTTSLSAAAGGAIGGHPGAIAGGAAAFIGKKMLGSYLSSKTHAWSSMALRKLAGSPLLGGLMQEHANKVLTKEISGAHGFLWDASKLAPYKEINPLRHFLGDKASGLSKQQQYDTVTATITKGATDPTFMQDHQAAIQQILGNNKQLAQLVQEKNQTALNYLYQQIPKNPNPPRPFVKDMWVPTPKQQIDFANKLAIVQDPMYVLGKVAMGTLTQEDVDIVKTIYPKILQSMQNHLSLVGSAKDAPDISAGMKQTLGLVLGMNLNNPNSINYQSAYVGSQQQGAAPPPPSKRGRGKGHTVASMGGYPKSKSVDPSKLPSWNTPVSRLDSKFK